MHENLNDLKPKVPPDDTTLTMWDVVTRRVQWRRTSIDVDPSAAASTSTTARKPNTAHASIFPEARSSPSLIPEQLCLSLIREQPRPSPPTTRSIPLPAPDQMCPPTVLPKATKNVRGKTQRNSGCNTLIFTRK
jgi:hypothetical protein